MVYTIDTRTVAAQPTLFVRGKTTIPNIAQSTDWAAGNGKRPAGPNRTEVVMPLAQ